ncbi:MAG: hypothetical protein ACHP7N_18595 [Caulobacterales bacterium]
MSGGEEERPAGGLIPRNLLRPALTAAALIALAFGVSRFVGRAPAPHPAPGVKPAAAPTSPPVASGPAQPMPTLAAAFALAYPKAQVEVPTDKGADMVTFSPQGLYRISADTFALVSAGQNQGESFHALGGYASVTYLVAGPPLALQGQPYILQGTMGGFGAPPQVTLLTGVSRWPMLEVESAYFNMGEGDGSAYLVSLGPTIKDVETVAEDIPVSYTNSVGGGRGCEISGKIVPLVQDQTFEVRYSGAWKGRQTYRLGEGGWTPDPTPKDLHVLCP